MPCSAVWRTAPISASCEVTGTREACGQPTCYAYPAMGGGWMALCHHHGQKHVGDSGTEHITTLILAGEILRQNKKCWH